MVFNEKAMKKLVSKDNYLKYVVKDLSNRNPESSETEMLEVAFNSNVLNDSIYQTVYQLELNKI